jgi:hypothetical protein
MRHFDFWHLWPLLRDVIAVLISAAGGAWTWFKVRHAHSWPSAQGTIMGAQAMTNPGSYIRPWVASFTYSYIVNGEYYSGFYRIRARTKRQAEEKAANWKGRMVAVRYSSKQHELSTLLKSDQPGGQLGN